MLPGHRVPWGKRHCSTTGLHIRESNTVKWEVNHLGAEWNKVLLEAVGNTTCASQELCSSHSRRHFSMMHYVRGKSLERSQTGHPHNIIWTGNQLFTDSCVLQVPPEEVSDKTNTILTAGKANIYPGNQTMEQKLKILDKAPPETLEGGE